MAIIDQFETSISIDPYRSSAREYDDNELDAKASESTVPTVQKYIEAESGKRFKICMNLHNGFRFDPAFNSISWDIYLDGQFMTGIIFIEEEYIREGSVGLARDHVKVLCDGQWAMQPFKFQDLDITQESISGQSKSITKRYKSLGTIEIRLWRYKHRGHQAEPTGVDPLYIDNSVSEKALKGRAITIGAGLGEAIPCRPSRPYSGTRVDEDPVAKFVFHYRTKKSLQELMVIRNDDLEEMTAEQLRDLVRQKMTQSTPVTDMKPKVKREVEIHDLDDEVVETHHRKKSKIISTEVIEIDSD